MSLSIGLTGGIGMGKSTTARIFAELGAQIWDADEAVARLYGPGGAGSHALSEVFPDAVTADGVDRDRLRHIITETPDALARIEALIHPILAEDRQAFRRAHPDSILIFDIPLLFETGLDQEMDHSVTVSTDPGTQEARVMARPGMDAALLQRLRARQFTDAARRARADHVIETMTLDSARVAAASLMREFQAELEQTRNA